MAPEVFTTDLEHLTPKADIFSLHIIFYEVRFFFKPRGFSQYYDVPGNPEDSYTFAARARGWLIWYSYLSSVGIYAQLAHSRKLLCNGAATFGGYTWCLHV